MIDPQTQAEFVDLMVRHFMSVLEERRAYIEYLVFAAATFMSLAFLFCVYVYRRSRLFWNEVLVKEQRISSMVADCVKCTQSVQSVQSKINRLPNLITDLYEGVNAAESILEELDEKLRQARVLLEMDLSARKTIAPDAVVIQKKKKISEIKG